MTKKKVGRPTKYPYVRIDECIMCGRISAAWIPNAQKARYRHYCGKQCVNDMRTASVKIAQEASRKLPKERERKILSTIPVPTDYENKLWGR